MSDEAIRAVASLDDAELDDEDSLSLLEDFNRAADALPAHLESLSDETKLRFYALFKQATVGKVTQPRSTATARDGGSAARGHAGWPSPATHGLQRQSCARSATWESQGFSTGRAEPSGTRGTPWAT